MKKYLNSDREHFIEFLKMPIDTSLQMLNLLKFKDEVEGEGISGQAQYKKYMKAAQPFFQKSNAKVLFYGDAQYALIGPKDLEWDKVLIVEYATKDDFVNMVTHPDYPSTLRTMALEDSRLIFCSSKTNE
ncbi:MAG: hypothetical protein AAF573_02465 [Bacteroidota bacterium]